MDFTARRCNVNVTTKEHGAVNQDFIRISNVYCNAPPTNKQDKSSPWIYFSENRHITNYTPLGFALPLHVSFHQMQEVLESIAARAPRVITSRLSPGV
jgi:hypothetical protein